MKTITKETLRSQQRVEHHEAPPLSRHEFSDLRKLILRETGISLGENRGELLRNRLRSRLVHHGLSSFGEYYHLLERQDPNGQELIQFINRVTTNKTEFLREAHHFEFLAQTVFPAVRQRSVSVKQRKLRIWSAGCSSGEEPYSIAMSALDYFAGTGYWDIKILGSDVDSKCLRTAVSGVYPKVAVENLSFDQKKRAFQKGKGPSRAFVRVRRELRELITFRRINFIDPVWPIRCEFDAIFCRNVLIYFEPEFQHRLVRRFLRLLKPEGFLFFGHSENLSWMPELKSLGNTIYVREDHVNGKQHRDRR